MQVLGGHDGKILLLSCNATQHSLENSILQSSKHEFICFITALSTELISLIIEFVHPASHLDFACSCQKIAACSSRILKRHRDAHRKYKVASDVHPATVPTLVRSALGLGDPILVWHVRSLEIWRGRSGWEEWKAYSHEIPIDNMYTGEQLHWQFKENEIRGCIEALSLLEDNERESGLRQLQDGRDGILKLLLMAHCPRIRDVKFVTESHGEENCLRWLAKLIEGIVSKKSDTWPLGLCALREVAVGVPSHTWMDEPSTEPSARVFATLFHLPHIKSIYYRDIFHDYDDDFDYDSYLPKGCSSVEHLFLDGCEGNSTEGDFTNAIAGALQALQAVAFCSGDSRFEDSDSFVAAFAEHQPRSLRSLMFYDFGRDPRNTVHGYRCTAFTPDELNGFRRLQQVSISVQDLDLQCLGELIHSAQDDKTNDEQYIYFVSECFPKTLQYLSLWGQTGSGHAGDCSGETILIEQALVKMIEGGEYPDLTSIHVKELEHRRPDEGPRSKFHFQKLIAVGEKAGVDVHTLTTNCTLKYELKYPEAPDAFSLLSGPYGGQRPRNWQFNPSVGKRIPPGCRNCGACDECLWEYPEHLWTRRKDGLN